MARKFVDRAYDHNEKAMSFYEIMIIVHVVLTVLFLIISIVVDKAFAWVEAYTLPALGYFINAHRKVTLDNPNILDKSNVSIEQANNQEMIKQNLRLERAMKRLMK
jgi:hypothetical protein